MSDYQHHPYHSAPLTPEEEERVRQAAEAPTAEFAKTAEFGVRSSCVPDAYQEYVARRRKSQPPVQKERGEGNFLLHAVLCMTAACLACIPFVGWIPASILWFIDAKWVRINEGAGGPIGVA